MWCFSIFFRGRLPAKCSRRAPAAANALTVDRTISASTELQTNSIVGIHENNRGGAVSLLTQTAIQPIQQTFHSPLVSSSFRLRALFLDRELAEEFVAMDVTILRLRSLAVEVPPWDFREEAGHPMELSEEGVPQWRCCFDEQCEARFESFKALATHVLRHHRQMEVSRSVITN